MPKDWAWKVKAFASTRKYMLDNDIMFNGAADPATKASQRGIAQAWNIAHLNAKERADNVTVLDTIVRIMNSYPQIVVQIHGTTTAPKKAQDELTRYFERPEELGREERSDAGSFLMCLGT